MPFGDGVSVDLDFTALEFPVGLDQLAQVLAAFRVDAFAGLRPEGHATGVPIGEVRDVTWRGPHACAGNGFDRLESAL